MGGDGVDVRRSDIAGWLKSTPPAWAGTIAASHLLSHSELKSTPPAWAGT